LLKNPGGGTTCRLNLARLRLQRIGEIWYNGVGQTPLPLLLVKWLFTSEKLSIQVHPSDADAKACEDCLRARKNAGILSTPSPVRYWASAPSGRLLR
jgi:mannose-6-phosphate isomerase class I